MWGWDQVVFVRWISQSWAKLHCATSIKVWWQFSCALTRFNVSHASSLTIKRVLGWSQCFSPLSILLFLWRTESSNSFTFLRWPTKPVPRCVDWECLWTTPCHELVTVFANAKTENLYWFSGRVLATYLYGVVPYVCGNGTRTGILSNYCAACSGNAPG